MRLLSAGENEKVNKQVAKQRQSSVQPESVHRAVFILCLKRWPVHRGRFVHRPVRARSATGQCPLDAAESVPAGRQRWHGHVRLREQNERKES